MHMSSQKTFLMLFLMLTCLCCGSHGSEDQSARAEMLAPTHFFFQILATTKVEQRQDLRQQRGAGGRSGYLVDKPATRSELMPGG